MLLMRILRGQYFKKGLIEGELFRPSCSIMSCPPPGGSFYLFIHSNMLSQILFDKTQDVDKNVENSLIGLLLFLLLVDN